MTPLEKRYPLARAAVSLQGSNPPAWQAFMQALITRQDETTDILVSATPERLQEMQGRARELRELLTELTKARETVEQKDKPTNGTRP